MISSVLSKVLFCVSSSLSLKDCLDISSFESCSEWSSFGACSLATSSFNAFTDVFSSFGDSFNSLLIWSFSKTEDCLTEIVGLSMAKVTLGSSVSVLFAEVLSTIIPGDFTSVEGSLKEISLETSDAIKSKFSVLANSWCSILCSSNVLVLSTEKAFFSSGVISTFDTSEVSTKEEVLSDFTSAKFSPASPNDTSDETEVHASLSPFTLNSFSSNSEVTSDCFSENSVSFAA